jgi:murein DD-endopeptidase MepM/ murein hydrolase activator NlpD
VSTDPSTPSRSPAASACEPYREVIEAAVRVGRNAKIIWQDLVSDHGFAIIVHHNNGWASYYANLQAIVAIRTDLYRPRMQRVRAGDAIGYVGAPSPGEFRRLYFELWRLNAERRFEPVDPRSQLGKWGLVRDHNHLTPAPPAARKEAA